MRSITILIILLLLLTANANISAQTVSYGYDDSGNRISRTIVIQNQVKVAAPTENPTVYSEMLSNIRLNIYPNPTDGWLKVEIQGMAEGQTANIMLYNLSGQLIVSLKEITDFTEIDISSQPAGTYLMKIIAGEYQTEWKIIKK